VDHEVKSQGVRLLDVFFIGPLMVWGGYALETKGHVYAGPTLALLGLSTILYNGYNHEVVRARNERRAT